MPLPHGEWKRHPNHVYLPDGTLLEYTPPEHVQPQMERLLDLYGKTEPAHPLVRAAWLHHQFIGIHPFADGNGRVARALTLLVLLRAGFAPLVVDRFHRKAYLERLDSANQGDLRPLVRLFASLEEVALRAELERVLRPVAVGATVRDVSRAYAQRLEALQRADRTERVAGAETLATQVHRQVVDYLTQAADDMEETFRSPDPGARAKVTEGTPPDERATWWRRQLIAAANRVDFYANLSKGSWWTRLHLTVFGHTLRYLAAVQKVGHGETGVLAVTVYAEALTKSEDGSPPSTEAMFEPTSTDSVTLVYSDRAEDRWGEVEELLDRTLAAALGVFVERLG